MPITPTEREKYEIHVNVGRMARAIRDAGGSLADKTLYINPKDDSFLFSPWVKPKERFLHTDHGNFPVMATPDIPEGGYYLADSGEEHSEYT